MRLGALTFDAADPQVAATFWGRLLDRNPRPARLLPSAWVLEPDGDELVWLFLGVPEPKTAKNRCHPDLHTATHDADVAKSVELGATVVAEHAEAGRWTVLHDPEGNEFCVVEDLDGESGA
ncbi:MAG: VOC family protein [Actinomycetes bacterium]